MIESEVLFLSGREKKKVTETFSFAFVDLTKECNNKVRQKATKSFVLFILVKQNKHLAPSNNIPLYLCLLFYFISFLSLSFSLSLFRPRTVLLADSLFPTLLILLVQSHIFFSFDHLHPPLFWICIFWFFFHSLNYLLHPLTFCFFLLSIFKYFHTFPSFFFSGFCKLIVNCNFPSFCFL